MYILENMSIIVLGPLHMLGPHILVGSMTIFNCGNMLVFEVTFVGVVAKESKEK